MQKWKGLYSEEFKVEMVKRIKAYPWKSNFKDELLFYFDELYSFGQEYFSNEENATC
jgi:hypothetical protein